MRVYNYKVTPIDRVINECKRRADDAWWDGNDDEARLHEQEAKLHEEDRDERGYQWVPNFQQQVCHQLCAQLGLQALYICGMYMQISEHDDTEDTNAPFDDVTHWVGNLPSKDTYSTKRPVKRYSWWQTKSNVLRSKLGVETKRED